MKTTIHLPDELMDELNQRAAGEGRHPQDVIVDLLAAGISSSAQPQNLPLSDRNLPVIRLRPALKSAAEGLTAQQWSDFVKDAHLQLEIEGYEKAFGHQHVDRADG